MTNQERRSYIEGEAIQAGIDPERAVNIIMSATEDDMDDDSFEQAVGDMIQDMPKQGDH